MEMTSSAEVRPASTLRTPSSRSVRMRSSRARCRSDNVELRLLIMWRTSSLITKISKMPIRPLTNLTASLAPYWLHYLSLGELAGLDLQRAQFGLAEFPWLFAVCAQSADKPLRHDCSHGGSDQKRLNTKIGQARHGRRRII